MKFIGQYIQNFIARFRSDVYLEDIDTGTIVSGGNLGLDSNNKIVKAAETSGDLTSIVAGTGLSGTSLTGPAPTLNVDAVQTQITSVGTLSGLTVDAIAAGFQSNVNAKPIVNIANYGNNTAGGMLQFILDKGAAGADNDIPGGIRWISDNDIQQSVNFGEIYTQVITAKDGAEISAMFLKVAEYDGTLTTGLQLQGAGDGEVDVTIASGTTSTTTIVSGVVMMGSLPTSDPSVAGQLWNNSGVVTVSAG